MIQVSKKLSVIYSGQSSSKSLATKDSKPFKHSLGAKARICMSQANDILEQRPGDFFVSLGSTVSLGDM